MSASLLVVEDDHATRTFLADNLTADGFDLTVADSVAAGLRALEDSQPDLALVDVGLGDGSGLELIARVRAADGLSRTHPGQRFLVLSGRAGEIDRLRGLRVGADDYLVKPFSYQELVLRVRALLRRDVSARRSGTLRVGDLVVDPVTRVVRLRGQPVHLSAKEFALLRALAADPLRVHTKDQLLRDVWGFKSFGATRTLDSHACRLRRKLGAGGDRYVVNVWGVGYRLLDPVAA